MTKQLLIKINPRSPLPLYKQISQGIAEIIESGFVSPGELLPSTRALSEFLSVSRLTVRQAYVELASNGYITAFRRGKTIVSKDRRKKRDSILMEPISFQPVLSSYAADLSQEFAKDDQSADANLLKRALSKEELPISHWRNCLQLAIKKFENELICTKNEPFGLEQLRAELKNYLARNRGLDCKTEQIIVFPSTSGNFELITRILLNRGDRLAIQDPCYSGIAESQSCSGFILESLAVNESGIDYSYLNSLENRPKMIYVTPSIPNSKGARMNGAQRAELLRWAVMHNCLILEDDFDSEYHYGQGREPALTSEAQPGSAIYIYNFWKALYPMLRMSIAVIPEGLIPIFREAMKSLHWDSPLIEQLALAEFIKRGHLGRQVHSCARNFSVRRALLIQALTSAFLNQLKITSNSSGTDLLVRFPAEWNPQVIEESAAKAGLLISSSAKAYIRASSSPNEYLVNFSTLKDSDIYSRVESFSRLCVLVPQLRAFNEASGAQISPRAAEPLRT